MSLMTRTLSMEAIQFQKGGPLFREMTALITEAKSDTTGSPSAVRKYRDRLEKLITSRTNLNIKIRLMDTTEYDYGIYTPDIDKNHPLLNDVRAAISKGGDLYSIFKESGNIINGSIDRVSGKVSGVFTKISCIMEIPKKALVGATSTSSKELTEDEIAAVILHEIGHAFTVFEYLGEAIGTNFILQTSVSAMLNTDVVKKKYKILKETEKMLSVSIEDKDALVSERDGSIVQMVLLKARTKVIRSNLGSLGYDQTASESLADQFANRHGAGEALVRALYKVDKPHIAATIIAGFDMIRDIIGLMGGMFIIYVLPAAYVTMPLILTGVLLVSLTFRFLTGTDPNNEYDSSKARMVRIRSDLVFRLKDNKLTSDEKEITLRQLSVIDTFIGKSKDADNMVSKLIYLMIPKLNNEKKQIVFQQQLDTLANNELFVAAAKLA